MSQLHGRVQQRSETFSAGTVCKARRKIFSVPWKFGALRCSRWTLTATDAFHTLTVYEEALCDTPNQRVCGQNQNPAEYFVAVGITSTAVLAQDSWRHEGIGHNHRERSRAI